MRIKYNNYKVKVRDSVFESKSGKIFDNTACISFYDENKKELQYIELGFCDTEEIYKKIDAGEDINLDESYVENFSLSTYRKSRKLKAETYITLNNFSAKNTYFDSKIETDFSFADFKGNLVCFEHSDFINGSVSFNSSRFADSKADFSYSFFDNGNVDFANTVFGEGAIEFKNAVFHAGTKNFQYADFGKGTNSFVNTEFGDGDVSFINVNFNDGKTSFKMARFGKGKIDFHFAKFGYDDISFERSEFGDGKVDFRKVEFGTGKVNFNRAVFGESDVNFEASELKKGRMTFLKSVFGGGKINFDIVEFDNSELVFSNTDFKQCSVYFSQAKFKKLIIKSSHFNNYFDLRVTKCEYIDLSDSIVRDIIDITPYDHDVDIKIINFSGVRLLGQIYIDWNSNNVKKLIDGQKDTSYSDKAEQYRVLKENYGNIGNYNYEDCAYIQFKRNELKASLKEPKKNRKTGLLWRYPLYIFKYLVFDVMGLYATSPVRVLTSLIAVYLTFSIVHFIAPFIINTSINCIDANAPFISKLSDTFYYSLITFTTVGYGDCSPVGFLRVVASVEGFLGVFMMSYFTVAFARKILR